MMRRSIIIPHKSRGKFTSKWDIPNVVLEVYINGADNIANIEGV